MGVFYMEIASPVSMLTLAERDGKLTNLYFGSVEPADGERVRTPLLTEAARQLALYFDGKLTCFHLPLSLHGTGFQKRVWDALTEIPYGETVSYADIAAAVGSGKAVRAVGQANHANPVPIIVPCHRVIRSDGSLGGYAGGTNAKIFLLSLEKENAGR